MKTNDGKIQGLNGGRGIVAAVLLRALSDVREGNPRLAAPAAAWIKSDREDHPLTFLRICELLDLNPAAVRKAARNGSRWRLRETGLIPGKRKGESLAR